MFPHYLDLSYRLEYVSWTLYIMFDYRPRAFQFEGLRVLPMFIARILLQILEIVVEEVFNRPFMMNAEKSIGVLINSSKVFDGAARYDSLLSILSIRIFFNSNSVSVAAASYEDCGWEDSLNRTASSMSDAERKFMNSSLVAPSLWDVDFCGGGVKDGNDGIMMENTGEESEITEISTVRSVGVCCLEGRDEKKILDNLKQDQEMLVIKIFSERKKDFRERKKCEKTRAKRGKNKGLVTHDLEGYEFKKTCNNDKNLSEIQLEHEKEDGFVVVVVKVGLYGGGEGDYKLEWWFEQDIDDEEEDDEEGEGGSEV
ncbi:hypothetical protein Tco_0828310 [Tanacetum coccineum]